jgi:pimeloyl-ACP methyl ester carboxylesterase
MIERELQLDATNHRLRGTFCAPADTGEAPVVLMIHGSGPLDRDENMKGQRLDVFNTIAHRLAQRGVASLRYDKRGCGASTGDYKSARQADFLADAIAWVDRLRADGHLSVYLLGHSEGCVIAPRASLERPHIAGLVLLCPPLTPFETILMQQALHIEREIATMPGLSGMMYRLLTKLVGAPSASQRKLIDRLKSTTSPTLRLGLRTVEAGSLRDLLQLDARAIFEQVRCPMLVIAGEKDVQCAAADATAIAELNPRAEAHVIAGLTHILRRDAGPPSIFSYGALLRQPVDSAVLDRIEVWLGSLHGAGSITC